MCSVVKHNPDNTNKDFISGDVALLEDLEPNTCIYCGDATLDIYDALRLICRR